MDEKYDSPMYGSSRTMKTLPPETESSQRAKRLLDLGDAMREKHGEFLWLFERLKDLGMSPDQAGRVACCVVAHNPIPL